uniref:Uncharacterized protein n=1 Tax=Malurus cyaneus samueli TaxID=2593467 RepID=A0A8C5TB84_9PASS
NMPLALKPGFWLRFSLYQESNKDCLTISMCAEEDKHCVTVRKDVGTSRFGNSTSFVL